MIDVSQPGTCRSCDARIYWRVEKSGRRNPYDRPTDCPGCQGAGCEVNGDRCSSCGGEGRVQVSHFATCPDAAAFRTRRPKDQAPR